MAGPSTRAFRTPGRIRKEKYEAKLGMATGVLNIGVGAAIGVGSGGIAGVIAGASVLAGVVQGLGGLAKYGAADGKFQRQRDASAARLAGLQKGHMQQAAADFSAGRVSAPAPTKVAGGRKAGAGQPKSGGGAFYNRVDARTGQVQRVKNGNKGR